jgi:hypothetical protein
MQIPVKLLTGLRENLQALIARSHSHAQLNCVVAFAHALAKAFLLSKRSVGRLSDLHGLNHSDIAYDCIAEIFQQNEHGEYVQLNAYFAGVNLHGASDQEALAHLRRLVFSKVNHGIFRLYNEADPVLSKILRNVKLAIISLNNFVEVERFDEACIAPSLCETNEHLPEPTLECLEREMRRNARGNESVPDLLSKFSLCLREQEEFSRVVPIVAVAMIFKSIYTSKSDSPADVPTVEERLVLDDAASIIVHACRRMKRQTSPRYVERGKVCHEVFEKYFQVIDTSLRQQLIMNDGEEFSYFESLKKLMPELRKEEYRKHHKSQLEYLRKLTYNEAVKQLRKG